MTWGNYQLREVSREDLDYLYEWRNADNVRSFMMNDDIIALDDHYSWFKSIEGDNRKKLMICLYEAKPIGSVQFTIDVKNQTCEWGFYIGDLSSPPGSGSMMGILALDYAFRQLAVRKVCAQVLDFNVKSLSYHRKLGFEEEGLLKSQIARNGKFINVILFGLLKENWEMVKPFLLGEGEKREKD